MAVATHYETLGLRATATVKEVKAAYRQVVLRHHPDRSSDPASTRIFIAATEAYETLSDGRARRLYDDGLASEARREAEREVEQCRRKDSDSRMRAARASSTAPTAASAPTGVALSTQLTRLSMLFSRGLYAEAEKLADEIVRRDPRQPLPYAIRGDLARSRGKLDEAARQYSLAIQMDPRNPTYLKRYEEVLERVQPAADGKAYVAPSDRLKIASIILGCIALLAGIFVALSPERAAFMGLGPVATWTVGLVTMLFVCGVAAGTCLSLGEGLDRLNAYATAGVGPTVALGIVSIVSFPAAAILYMVVGLAQRGFSATTTRLIASVTAIVVVLAAGSALSNARIEPLSVLLWGGNLTYLGALCGWAVADGTRQ